MHHPLSRRLAVFLVAASLAACTDPELAGTGDPASAEPAAKSEALHSVKVAIRSTLITDFAVPLGCKGLEGSVFLPDLSGNTHGTTISNSDCTWNAAAQQCECTVTYTQRP